MRFVSILIVVVLSLAVGPHHKSRINACDFPNSPEIQEVGKRFHRVFAEVIHAFRFDISDFALCTDTTATMPGARWVYVGNKRITLFRLPRFAEDLSDLALRGLLGHEVGHVKVGFRPYSIAYEKQVDLVTAEKVGFDAVMQCHREMIELLYLANPQMFAMLGTREGIEDRMRALTESRTKPDLS